MAGLTFPNTFVANTTILSSAVNANFSTLSTLINTTLLDNSNISASAAIARSKLASGTAYVLVANNSSGVMAENAAITASRAVASDANGQLVAATTTATELGYVNGVTSAIQTQINTKAPSASPTFTGTITTPLTASRAVALGASSELVASTTTATELGYVNGVTSAIQTQINTKAPSASPTFTGTVTTPVTASRAVVTDGSSALAASATTATELGYVNGVTSAIQTQINTKAPTASPTFSGTITTPLTASRALTSGASSELAVSATTATELGYVNGVTSAIQTQINTKLPTTITTTGDMIYSSSGSTGARLAIGSSGQVLSVAGGIPSWAAAPSGGINYIGNDDAETDVSSWATYADAAGNVPVNGTAGSPNTTWTRTTTTPLRGAGSFLWTKASGASRQGEGVSYDFTLDSADQAKVCGISFDYIVASGTFTASDGITAPLGDGTTTTTAGNSTVQVFMYDVTNAVLIPVTPSVLTSNSTTTPSSYRGSFQTASNSTSYRLILHTAMATDAAMTAKFDNFYVGPDTTKALLGAPVTDWVAYTPTIVGFGTPTKNFFYRRVGDSIEVQGNFVSGTPSADVASVTLPAGTAIDSTKLPTTTNGTQLSAFSNTNGASSGLGTNGVAAAAFYDGSDTAKVYLTYQIHNSSNGYVKVNGNAFAASGTIFSVRFTVPIAGWGSNVLMSNDTDTRVVSASYYVSAATFSATTTTPINYDTKIYDTHSAVTTSASAWKFTAPVSGYYQIGGYYSVTAATSRMAVYKNGTIVTDIAGDSWTGGSAPNYTLKLVAGDYIDFRPGSNKDIQGGALSDAAVTKIVITRVTGPATVAASEKVFAVYNSNGGTVITGSTTNIDFSTKDKDSHSAWSGTTFTAPYAGLYNISGTVKTTSASSQNVYAYVNTVYKYNLSTSATSQFKQMSGALYLNAGDALTIRADAMTLSNSATDHWISISSQ